VLYWRAKNSRREREKCACEFWNIVAFFQPIRENSEGQGFHFPLSLFLGHAIAQRTRERGDFCNPTTIGFAVKLDSELSHSFINTPRTGVRQEKVGIGRD